MSTNPNLPQVLIVDDDVNLCELMPILLAREGFRTKTAISGREALDWLETNTPDAIVLDIMMPEMNGFELLQHMQDRFSGRSFPIIMLSARMDADAVARSRQGGADAWLNKSGDWQHLIAELKQRVGRHGAN